MNKVLLISLALLLAISTGVIGCAGGVTRYNLTMAVAPPGSGTTTPSGTTSRAAGAVVIIQAAAAAGYQFSHWSAPAGSFGNANLPTTIFIMPAQNVTVTAHFVGPLDHFKGYQVDYKTAPYIGESVSLEDQFVAVNATVEWALFFCNPVGKVHDQEETPVSNPDHHLTLYNIHYEGKARTWQVEVKNQFGTQNLTVLGPIGLAVPTQKDGLPPPVSLDHFLLYSVMYGAPLGVSVGLIDQFVDEQVDVGEPVLFANPVQKTVGDEVTEIENPDKHLVFYAIEGGVFQTQVQIDNQFGEQTLDVGNPYYLGVPSEKVNFVEVKPLDHFKCYDVVDAPPLDVYVDLMDQFDYYDNVQVKYANWFCNPVEKTLEVPTAIVNPDNHLTIYTLLNVEPQMWQVEVESQFGLQELTVVGPVALAVPTQKLYPGDHGPPVGLDHFLLYMVIDSTPLQIPVIGLADQFGPEPDWVTVTEPVFFANPVQKDNKGIVTEIENPAAHLVFYKITGVVSYPQVQVVDQFVEQTLYLGDPYMLAVPSAKLSAEPAK